MVISDHSKTAAYANGLSEERIARSQHAYRSEELDTKRWFLFKIFKSIESDILRRWIARLFRQDAFSFDLVIASVHSNLKMSEEKAMSRLLKAISNPYTNYTGSHDRRDY